MTSLVDFQLSLEQAGGNEALAKELFGMLLTELPVLHSKLKHAIASRDLPSCWDHAHKIYGSTAYCGVPVLREAARAIEGAIKKGDFCSIDTHLPQLEDAVVSLLEKGPAYLHNTWGSSE